MKRFPECIWCGRPVPSEILNSESARKDGWIVANVGDVVVYGCTKCADSCGNKEAITHSLLVFGAAFADGQDPHERAAKLRGNSVGVLCDHCKEPLYSQEIEVYASENGKRMSIFPSGHAATEFAAKFGWEVIKNVITCPQCVEKRVPC